VTNAIEVVVVFALAFASFNLGYQWHALRVQERLYQMNRHVDEAFDAAERGMHSVWRQEFNAALKDLNL
jgi:hypothetical protein